MLRICALQRYIHVMFKMMQQAWWCIDWLAIWAGSMVLNLPLSGFPSLVPQEKTSLYHRINPLLTRFAPCFWALIDIDVKYIELGQYQLILTSLLDNTPHIISFSSVMRNKTYETETSNILRNYKCTLFPVLLHFFIPGTHSTKSVLRPASMKNKKPLTCKYFLSALLSV